MQAYRAITKQAVAAFIAGVPFAKDNTEVRIVERPGEIMVELLLHDNPIARRWPTHPEQGVEITTSGWNSYTTRERLNGIPGVSVHQSKHVLYLNGLSWSGDWTSLNLNLTQEHTPA